ncbi:MAG TPA: arginase, partial [Gammaproteobacteria bacterium]|nr:arginase [Gammaproteobacteria bacterium]
MNQKQKNLNIIGVASCYGAQDLRCANGPLTLKKLHLKETLENKGWHIQWDKNIYPQSLPVDQNASYLLVLDICKQLARQTHKLVMQDQRFIVIGGDHSCAIGTWSGVYSALERDFGLIWIDAHMDSHTRKTSPSGALHGMPLAALLGHGDKALCNIERPGQKLKPQNLCLVG